MWKYKIFSIVVLMFVGGTHCAVRVHCQGSTGRETATNSSRSAVPSGPRSTPLVAVPVRSDGSKDFPKVEKDFEGVHHIAKFGIYVYILDSLVLVVWKVDPSGPAARAGIRKDDQLESVNGRQVSCEDCAGDVNVSIQALITALRVSGNRPAKIEVYRPDLQNSGKGSSQKPEDHEKTFIVMPLP